LSNTILERPNRFSKNEVGCMSSIYEKDWYRGVVFGLMMIGIAVVLVGGALFIDATLKMQNNYAYKIRSEPGTTEISDAAQARVLMVSDLELRELIEQRSNALILGGLGLVSLAVGWIGYDLMRARQRKLNAPHQSTAG
jgi:hypothetical protein